MTTTVPQTEQHVKLLGVLSLVIGGLTALTSLAIFGFLSMVTIVPPGGFAGGPAPVMLVLMGLMLAFSLLPAVLAFATGFGLLKGRAWARTTGFVLSVLALVAFPIGTAFGVYGLWVLTRPDLPDVLGSRAGAAGA